MSEKRAKQEASKADKGNSTPKKRALKSVFAQALKEEDDEEDAHHVDALAKVIGKQEESGLGHALANATLGGITMAEIAKQAQDKREADPSSKRLTLGDKSSLEALTPEDREDIRTAFARYDVMKVGFLDGGKLRMALRELGFNTPDTKCQQWATCTRKAGMNLEELELLVSSGKLGPQIIKQVQGSKAMTENQVKLRSQKLEVQAAKKKPHKQGVPLFAHERRYALTACKDAASSLPAIDIPGMAKVMAPKLDGNSDMTKHISPARRRELKEVFNQFDHDQVGFLQVDQFNGALKALGLHFDPATVVRTCQKYGGVFNMASFCAVASTQVHYQDQLLEVHDFFVNDGHEEDAEFQGRESIASLANVNEHGESRQQLREAYAHMRATACTNKNRKWRNFFLTTHHQIGEHGTGCRLYFDLLLMMAFAFVVLSSTNMELFLKCWHSTAQVIIIGQIRSETGLEIPVKMSVANLPRLSEKKGIEFAAQDASGILLVELLMIAFVALWIPRAIRGSASTGRLEDLAVCVDKLPKELPDEIHDQYQERLEHHFNSVYQLGQRDDDDSVAMLAPVEEVVVCRNYYGAIQGVLKQVRLLKKAKILEAHSVRLESKQLQLQQSLGIDTSKRKASVVSVLSGFSNDSDEIIAGNEGAKKEQMKFKKSKKTQKQIALLQDHIHKIRQEREQVEEKMLELETARGAHADMKTEERDVIAAYIVFSTSKGRDRILSTYRWSSKRCCRTKCCQRKDIRFGNRLEEDAPSSEDESVPIRVKEAHDPSLILWENVDLHRAKRIVFKWRTRCIVFLMWIISTIVAWAVHAYSTDIPAFTPFAGAWVIANTTPPSNNGTYSASTCFQACELEFFADESCTIRVTPVAYISSNNLKVWDDAGLRFLGDRNLGESSRCEQRWLPSNCWETYSAESLASSVAVGSRRLADIDWATSSTTTSISSSSTTIESTTTTTLTTVTTTSSSTTVLSEERQRAHVFERIRHRSDGDDEWQTSPWTSQKERWRDPKRRLQSCAWLKNMNISVLHLRFLYQAADNPAAKRANVEALVLAHLTEMIQGSPITEPVIQLQELTPHVFHVAGMAAAPTISTPSGCRDQADAPQKLTALLGLSGPEAMELRSCRDFAVMGLLGVAELGASIARPAFCDFLPQAYRCLCAETCFCQCADGPNGACDCDQPTDGLPLLPIADGTRGIVTTMEHHFYMCVPDGIQLLGIACDSETYSTGFLLMKRDQYLAQGILPIAALVQAPDLRECGAGPSCGNGAVHCLSRFGFKVCAPLCNGFEECADGIDELNCRSGCPVSDMCSYYPGRCVDSYSSAEACGNCKEMSSDSCAPLEITAGNHGSIPPAQCSLSDIEEKMLSYPACDPLSADYEPCSCQTTLTNRMDFGCLMRGNVRAALGRYLGLMAYYAFEKVRAGKIDDELGNARPLACMSGDGPSARCNAVEEGKVNNMGQFDSGEVWMTSSEIDFPASAAHAVVLWIKTAFESQTLFTTAGNGVVVMKDKKLAVDVAGALWAPGLGPALDDDVWHCVAHSIGTEHGERFFVDGEVVAARTMSDATAAGWSLGAGTVTFGACAGNDGSLLATCSHPVFVGMVDEMAIFQQELSDEDVAHIKISASWRGSGPTFLERYLAAPCQDARLAAVSPACGSKQADLMAAHPPCQQGDACGCLKLLLPKRRSELTCSIPIPGSTNDLKRTFLGLFQEQCGDAVYYSHSCENDYDCFDRHPPDSDLFKDMKWQCNTAINQCELMAAHVGTAHTASAEFCVAYKPEYLPSGLSKWQGMNIVAALSGVNTSKFKHVTVEPGCKFTDDIFGFNDVQVLTAHNGTTQGVTLDPGGITQKTEDGRMRVGADGVVTNAGGLQTLYAELIPNDHKSDSLNEMRTLAFPRLLSVPFRYIPQQGLPNGTSAEDVIVGIPPVPSMAFPVPDDINDTALATVGQVVAPIVRTQYEKCTDTEFMCELGICIRCPNDICLCDRWADCPGGQDEDPEYIANYDSEIPKNCDLNVSADDEAGACRGMQGMICNISGTEACVPDAKRCDTYADCDNGTDEVDCPTGTDDTDAHTWVGAIFREDQPVQCIRLSQPPEAVADLAVYMCDRAAAVHAGDQNPMTNPARACRQQGGKMTVKPTPLSRLSSWQKILASLQDYAFGEAKPPWAGDKCALGLRITPQNTITYAAAILAREREGEDSSITACFCEQRLQLEPDLYLSYDFAMNDERYEMCWYPIWRFNFNKLACFLRVVLIFVIDEIYRSIIHAWATKQRHWDETAQISSHFWMLTVGLLVNTALLPILMNCHLPMREFHAYVGISIVGIMSIRVVYPNTRGLLCMVNGCCQRRIKRRNCITQDMLNDLYTLPPFELVEGYAELTVTSCVALVYGPAMPVLNFLACINLCAAYFMDRIVFLRGSHRPPFYDERIAKDCLWFLVLGTMIHTISAAVVFQDQDIFPSDGEDCGGDTPEIQASPKNTDLADDGPNAKPLWWYADLTSLWKCSPASAAFSTPFTASLAALALLPIMPVVVKFCRKRICRFKDGIKYEVVAAKRRRAHLMASYNPRDHPKYKAAFKLVDLAAAFEEDAMVGDFEDADGDGIPDSSSSGSDTEIAQKAKEMSQKLKEEPLSLEDREKDTATLREELLLIKMQQARVLEQVKAEQDEGKLEPEDASNHPEVVADSEAEAGKTRGRRNRLDPKDAEAEERRSRRRRSKESSRPTREGDRRGERDREGDRDRDRDRSRRAASRRRAESDSEKPARENGASAKEKSKSVQPLDRTSKLPGTRPTHARKKAESGDSIKKSEVGKSESESSRGASSRLQVPKSPREDVPRSPRGADSESRSSARPKKAREPSRSRDKDGDERPGAQKSKPKRRPPPDASEQT